MRQSIRVVKARLAVLTVIVLAMLSGCVGEVRSTHAASGQSFEAETMSLPRTTGATYHNSEASAEEELLYWSNGTASTRVPAPSVEGIVVRARGDQCDGAPHMEVGVGDVQLSHVVSTAYWADYSADITLPSGQHEVKISFTNNHQSATCDRNLRVDRVTLVSSTNPFVGEEFWVHPNSMARKTADKWYAEGRIEDAKQMEKLARNHMSEWFGNLNTNIQADVNEHVTAVRDQQGALPVLVAYNIPVKDCGNYSAGGAASANEYKRWIDGFAAGIGNHKAIVVLEPDAVAGWGCLHETDRANRKELLGYAISTLKDKPYTYVYVDAGNPGWHSASVMAARLNSIPGIERADGFSLNVANYFTYRESVRYGEDVSGDRGAIGGKHFIIDTGRVRLGPPEPGEWCNPDRAAIGAQPTAARDHPLVDAVVWVKQPGYSDGPCKSGFDDPGTWHPEYALKMAER